MFQIVHCLISDLPENFTKIRSYSGNTWLCVHWHYHTCPCAYQWFQGCACKVCETHRLKVKWQKRTGQRSTWVVSTKCTPGFACRAFSDTTLVCFIVNEHTTKCSRYNERHESGVTKCTRGEAWSGFSWHHSRVFHCQWTHNQVFLLLSHMLI